MRILITVADDMWYYLRHPSLRLACNERPLADLEVSDALGRYVKACNRMGFLYIFKASSHSISISFSELEVPMEVREEFVQTRNLAALLVVG